MHRYIKIELNPQNRSITFHHRHRERNKSIQITDLVEQFDVSVMTIRRDLAELEEKKYITRVYGGAVLNEEELNRLFAINCG